MSRVVHFEIHADNPERVAEFYNKCFGWEFTKWEGPMEYWLVKTGPDDKPGINGGMMRRKDPQGNVYNTVEVENIDEAIKTITKSGGEIVVPKMAIPSVGYSAYFKDPDGNIGGVHQTDPNAA